MNYAVLALLLFAVADHTGPAVGTPAPDFSLLDQDNQPRSLKNILGSKGAILVFYRSADW